MKNLQDKAINIKGKDYVLVSDRILAFNELYKNGSIVTELVSQTLDKMVVVKARVTPDVANPERYFTGYSQAVWGDGYINKSSALENCETSAVGRALGMMGIGVLDSVASVDEVNKAESQQEAHEVVSGLSAECPLHKGATLVEMISKKTGNPYFAHRLPNGSMCFGKELKK